MRESGPNPVEESSANGDSKRPAPISSARPVGRNGAEDAESTESALESSARRASTRPGRVPWLPTATSANGPASVEAQGSESALPLTQPAADLARAHMPRVWTALCFALTFAIYVSLVPRFVLYSSPPTGDQPFYLMDTASIAEDGDLNVANNYAHRDENKFYSLAPHPPGFVGMSAPYPLPGQFAASVARPAEERYAYHLPGLGIALVPAWVIGSFFSLWWPATVVFMCLVGALLAVNVFLLAYETTGRRWIAWAVWLPIAFSNPIWIYSYLIFTELPVGLLLLYAFRRMALGWGSNNHWRLLLVGLCIGYMPWLAWRTVLVAVPLGGYAFIQWLRYLRANREPSTDEERAASAEGRAYPGWKGALKSLLWVAGPVLLSAALLLWYNRFLYNSIFPPTKVPELGDASPFLWPWQGSDQFTHFITSGFGLLFDRQMGLLTYAPIYLLSVVGVIAMWRLGRAADRRLLAAIALVILPYVGMLASFVYWHGIWGPPARYPTSLVPLLAAPLGMSLFALSRSWIYKVVYAVLALPGFLLAGAMLYDARMMWPANPVLGWLAGKMPYILSGLPNLGFRIDVYSALPNFNPIDEVRLPAATAWVIGVSLLIVFGCYLLLMYQGRVARKLSTRAHGIAWIIVLAALGSGWLVMNHDYIKHKTDLVQLTLWTLSPAPAQPRGMAYMGGKLFISDYDGKALYELDTTTGAYQSVKPVFSQTTLPYTRPGDVKVGPDGLLYVLNNGPDKQAMYVMKPDGQVARQETLIGKSDTAVGLSFGPDGKMYVADTVGGRIFKYDPQGGQPLADISGQTRDFNNVWGVAVDQDGTIYAAESSNNRIQQIDAQGKFVRAFDLACMPTYIAISGDWLDTLCGGQFLSVNKKSGDIQRAQIEGEVPPISSASSLAYDPNGTLYVLQGSNVVAYRIEH